MSARKSPHPLERFFALESAVDLRDKLRLDFELLQANPADCYLAFNFFVTAEHMLDWVHPGASGRVAREQEKSGSVLLQICSHLANGGKHFRVEHEQHKTVSSARLGGGFFGARYWGQRYWGGKYWGHGGGLFVDLDGDALAHFGPTISVLDLAQRVLAHWNKAF